MLKQKPRTWLSLGLLVPLLFAAVQLVYRFPDVLAQDIIVKPPPGQSSSPLTPPLALVAHQVDAVIDGPVATVHLTQVFRNDSSRPVEGTYIFPLPTDAAVSDFQMTVDGKTLEGKLLSKDEARRIYEEIVRRQRDPALLQYIGHGLFQANVFPIPAGASRKLELSYTQVVAQRDGLYQFLYPLRAQQTGAGSIESLAINIELRHQPGLRTIYSPNYNISVDRTGDDSAKIGYEATHVQPESDFQLFFGADQKTIGLNLLSYKPTGEDGFFVLLAAPGIDVEPQQVVQRDVVLVVDVSGSMQGEKIEQARKAAHYVVDHLNAGDRFNLISFSTGVRLWKSTLQPAGQTSAKDAHDWINQLTATGSTDINRALLEALGQFQNGGQNAANRPAYLLFLTDGLPTQGETDPQRIIDNATRNKPTQRSIRLFTFGVGFDVNTDLLDTLSQELNGRSSYVKPEEQIDEEVSQFYSQVSTPVLSGVTVDLGNKVTVDEIYPYPLPDLFAGEQLVVVGRYHGSADVAITLRGSVNGQKITYQYPNQHLVTDGGEPFVARLWATRKIGALLAQIRRTGPNQELINAITSLSLQYGVVTPYTSYLVEEPNVQAAQAQDHGQAPLRPQAVQTQAAATVESKIAADAAAPASGAAAVNASEARTQLETADNLQAQQAARYVNGKTFAPQGWVKAADGTQVQLWVDTQYTEKMKLETVTFGSERYFALSKQPQMAAWLAVSSELVLVVDKDHAVRITTAGK